MSGKWLWTLAALAAGCLAACNAPPVRIAQVENPYGPRYRHEYRHGAVPTREAARCKYARGTGASA